MTMENTHIARLHLADIMGKITNQREKNMIYHYKLGALEKDVESINKSISRIDGLIVDIRKDAATSRRWFIGLVVTSAIVAIKLFIHF